MNISRCIEVRVKSTLCSSKTRLYQQTLKHIEMLIFENHTPSKFRIRVISYLQVISSFIPKHIIFGPLKVPHSSLQLFNGPYLEYSDIFLTLQQQMQSRVLCKPDMHEASTSRSIRNVMHLFCIKLIFWALIQTELVTLHNGVIPTEQFFHPKSF